MAQQSTAFDIEKAAAVLGVSAPLGDEELRAAYLQKVQEHPPDREPELFEQIRDAYEHLRNPDVRAQAVLEGPDPTAPLQTLLDGLKPQRTYVGSQLWMELLKEKRS
jgi:hypothetical protein